MARWRTHHKMRRGCLLAPRRRPRDVLLRRPRDARSPQRARKVHRGHGNVASLRGLCPRKPAGHAYRSAKAHAAARCGRPPSVLRRQNHPLFRWHVWKEPSPASSTRRWLRRMGDGAAPVAWVLARWDRIGSAEPSRLQFLPHGPAVRRARAPRAYPEPLGFPTEYRPPSVRSPLRLASPHIATRGLAVGFFRDS